MNTRHICKNEKTTTSFFYEYEKEHYIIIENVPCGKCQICGEIVYYSPVDENIHRIIERLKSSKSEMIIVDYNDVI